MSTGIGKTQREILARLDAPPEGQWCWTVTELAAAMGLSDRQVRRAVWNLHARGLAHVWSGHTDSKPLQRWRTDRLDKPWGQKAKTEHPDGFLVREGEDWPLYKGQRVDSHPKWWVASRDVWCYPVEGWMPVYGLMVATMERWEANEVRRDLSKVHWARMFGRL